MFVEFLILSALLGDPSEVSPPKPQPLNVQIWHDFYHARINMRYHQIEAASYDNLDLMCRWAGLLLSVIAIAGPAVAKKPKWQKWWYALGFTAFLFALAPLVWSLGDLSRRHDELASRWGEIASKWHPLYDESLSGDPTQLAPKIAELRSEMNETTKDERGLHYRPHVMGEAERAENEFQGVIGDANSGWWWIKDVPVPPFGIRSLYVILAVLTGILALLGWRYWPSRPATAS